MIKIKEYPESFEPPYSPPEPLYEGEEVEVHCDVCNHIFDVLDTDTEIDCPRCGVPFDVDRMAAQDEMTMCVFCGRWFNDKDIQLELDSCFGVCLTCGDYHPLLPSGDATDKLTVYVMTNACFVAHVARKEQVGFIREKLIELVGLNGNGGK
jgi:hypothetical protein